MNRWLKVAALVGLLLGGGSPAFAMVCGGGYSQTETSHTVFEHACYEYYFNNSGATQTSGSVVVFDTSGTGVNQSVELNASRNDVDSNANDGDVDNIFTYITTTTTADSELVAGVVDDDSCVDQSYCRVQVRGPRVTRCGNTDTVAGEAVCTSTTAGVCGDCAANPDGVLGLASQTTTAPNAVTWVNINPTYGE